VERKESGMDFSLLFDQIIINAKEKWIDLIELNASKSEKQWFIGYSLRPLYGFTEKTWSRSEIIDHIQNQLDGTQAITDVNPLVKKQLDIIIKRYEMGYYNDWSKYSIIRDVYGIVVPPVPWSICTWYDFRKKYGCAFYGEFPIWEEGEQTQHEKEFQRYKKNKERNQTEKKE
jgi:hypothetical protein